MSDTIAQNVADATDKSKIDETGATHKENLIPDFDKLADAGHDFTPGAVPPALPEGESAKVKRGPGRPRKEAGSVKTFTGKKPAPPPGEASAKAKGGAVLVVSSVDMVMQALCDGKFESEDVLRNAYIDAWAEYIESIGGDIPPWAAVALITIPYTGQAFKAPTFMDKAKWMGSKIKGWIFGK